MEGNGPRVEALRDGSASLSDARAQQILAAASRAIVRLGFGSTRIADIAGEAGTSTGTVHYYFETKDDVLVAALRWANEQAYAHMDRTLDARADATTKLAQLIELSVPYPGLPREWWVLWIELWTRVPHRPELLGPSEQLSRRWRGYFFDVIRRGAETGEFGPVAEPDAVAERLIALVDGFAFQVIAGHHWMPPERMRELVLEFVAEQLEVAYEKLEHAALATKHA